MEKKMGVVAHTCHSSYGSVREAITEVTPFWIRETL
jgi:hypothetical protein